MINSIKTIEDVQVFFNHLLNKGLNFHPDTPFEDYINVDSGENIFDR